MINKI